jgi:integrase
LATDKATGLARKCESRSRPSDVLEQRRASGPTIGKDRSLPGTVSAAIAGYYTHNSFLALGASTRQARRAVLEKFRAEHGQRRLVQMRQRDVAGASYTTGTGLGNRMREWFDAAGLPQCSAHGLRKACCRRLAEAGCSAHEIMAISGHVTLAEAQRYTVEANKTKLARAAMEKQVRAAENVS